MNLEFWNIVWGTALVLGFCGFTYISFRVIVRGFAEAKSLLGLSEEHPGGGKKGNSETPAKGST